MTPSASRFVQPIAFATPRLLSASSAWIEHVPFAMNLVEVARPRVLVELGTHAGVSYCAFCQAVDATGLDTRCFAVDTWTGDEHTGEYGPEVLAELRAHHDPAYGRFSRLVQSTFAEAARHFADGEIDLLHIDGLHTYETVRADFVTWLPKLSARGIVLFHDINVRERGFGVWRLWDEVRSGRRSFDFLHGHGLGVLAVGSETPQELDPLFAASPAVEAEIRAVFHDLGRRLTLETEVARLRETIVSREADVGRLRETIASREAELEQRAREIEVRDARMRDAETALAGAEAAAREARDLRDAIEREFAASRASAGWRAVERLRAFRDRLAPAETLRRRGYDAVLSVIGRSRSR
jgi:hypothetical protein